jgi:hypothetical protein
MLANRDSICPLKSYIPNTIFQILKDARLNIGFNIGLLLVITYAALSLTWAEKYLPAIYWILSGILCLHQTTYLVLDCLLGFVVFWSCCATFRDHKIYLGFALFILVYLWLLRLVKVSFPRLKLFFMTSSFQPSQQSKEEKQNPPWSSPVSYNTMSAERRARIDAIRQTSVETRAQISRLANDQEYLRRLDEYLDTTTDMNK